MTVLVVLHFTSHCKHAREALRCCCTNKITTGAGFSSAHSVCVHWSTYTPTICRSQLP